MLALLVVLLWPAVGWAQTPPPPAPGASGEIVEYYATDALGSIRVVFTPQGAEVARADYLPFGERFTATGPLPPQQFTGQQRDPEAQLDHFNARSYQTTTGRFTGMDPAYAGLFDPQQWNRYAYARTNPSKFVDPTGRNAEGLDVPRRPLNEGWTDSVTSTGSVGLSLIAALQLNFILTPIPGIGGGPGGGGPGGEPEGAGGRGRPGTGSAGNGNSGAEGSSGSTNSTVPTGAANPDDQCVPYGPGTGGGTVRSRIAQVSGMRSLAFLGGPLASAGVAAWWVNKVKIGGDWDDKKDGNPDYEDFGNFSFGATAYALGVPLNAAQRAAGAVQIYAGSINEHTGRREHLNPHLGWPGFDGNAPYGDDISDHFFISSGYQFARNGGSCR